MTDPNTIDQDRNRGENRSEMNATLTCARFAVAAAKGNRMAATINSRTIVTLSGTLDANTARATTLVVINIPSRMTAAAPNPNRIFSSGTNMAPAPPKAVS